MTPLFGHVAGGIRAEGIALWALSTLLVFGAHIGAVLWLLRTPPIVAADAPPPTIRIDVASVPEAVLTDRQEISDEEVDAVDSTQSQASPEVNEVEPKDFAQIAEEVELIQETNAAEMISEIVEEDLSPVESEVALAVSEADEISPEPEKKTAEEKKPEREKRRMQQASRPQQNSAASREKRRMRAQVRRSNRNTAPRSSSGSSSASSASWRSRVLAHLNRYKRKPGSGQRGTVSVRFGIDGRGNVRSVSVTRSSGSPTLDRAALSTVRRASPVPAPPAGARKTQTVAIRFR